MYLYGASGHALVIIDILRDENINLKGLIDDNPNIKTLDGIEVSQYSENLSPIIISIGDNHTRKKISERLNTAYFSAIHRSAIISKSVIIGQGSVIAHGAIIQAKSIIGEHCIINTGASIDHECKIGNYCHVSPKATLCGNVDVGEGAWIGAGSTIIQGVKIGKWSIVGAGSVVTKDIPDNTLVAGCPAKIIKHLK